MDPTVSKKRKNWDKFFPYIFTLLFLSLSILLVLKHELWRDEVKTWLVGSESISIRNFIYNIRENHGQPYLWSFIQYLISHYIGYYIEAVKIVHLIISTSTAFLVLKFAPFNKLIRALIIFSYFFFFEYSILSRNYAIGILSIIIFCILYKNKYKNLIFLGIALLAM